MSDSFYVFSEEAKKQMQEAFNKFSEEEQATIKKMAARFGREMSVSYELKPPEPPQNR